MEISVKPIKNINDLIQEIRILQSTKTRWLFRGQADSSWHLLPGIKRGYTFNQEKYFTNEFRVRARSRHHVCPEDNNYSGWLTLMQHYGLPTRLLDWSYSPLVASFFAVHPDYYDLSYGDSCIWAMAPRILNETQGYEHIVFPIDAKSFEELIVPAFKKRDEPNKIGVAMGIEHDSRIQLQQGAFSVHSLPTPIDLIPDAHMYLKKYIIGKEYVSDFIIELEMLGITKSYLFPDLGSLSSDLKSRYKPNIT